MIAIVQRVTSAKISINNKTYNKINKGLLVLLGIDKDDSEQDLDYLIHKVTKLRIFNDDMNKMNLSISDINGDLMVVSQFTLLANVQKGMRPSFINAAKPNVAEKWYNLFIDKLTETNLNIKTGKFGAMMDIDLINHGPATFILDSKN
tara:strand:- start:190 stop:633 length:444 start_codon:yes stop_codon:yes gene_type:complete